MIRAILKSAFLCFVSYLLGLFVIVQYIYWTDIKTINGLEDIQFTFDFYYLKYNEYSSYLNILNICVLGLFLILVVNEFLKSSRFKTEYQKGSYNKLLTTFERKRGTVRVQFKDDGTITRKTLECAYDRFFAPITKLQNKLMYQYKRPANNYWNTPKLRKQIDDKKFFNASGIPVVAYRKYFLFGQFNRINYIDSVIHALFVGMTGKGKSLTFVLPMIQSNIDAGESMFVHDPKRELLATTKKQLEEEGYKIIVLDFVNPEYSDGWNPLDFALDRWEKAIDVAKIKMTEKLTKEVEEYIIEQNNCGIQVSEEKKTEMLKEVSEVVNQMTYRDANLSEAIELVLDISKTVTFTEDAKDPFWTEGAGDMLAGAVFLMLEEGIKEYVNFASVNYIYQLGEEKEVLKRYLKKYRKHDDESVLKMDTFFSAEGTTRGSLKATFKNKLSILTSTPNIQSMLAKSTWSYDEIFDKKTAIFMVTHDEKSTYYSLVTIFIKQMYEAMVKWTRDNAIEYNNRLKIPWNMYIDEMGLLPEIKDIEAIFGAARSRGMRMYCFFQSFAQLEQKYELTGSRIIQDNATHTIYLGSKLKEVADEFEKIAGKEVYYNAKSKRMEERSLITSEKLQKFEKGRALITSLEWDPYIAKLPPYDEYVFAKEPSYEFEKVDKPKVKWFNILEVTNERQLKKDAKQGVKSISFDKL